MRTGQESLSSPSPDPFPVTPSDSEDLMDDSKPCCLLISVGGTVKVTTAAGNTVVLTVPAGVFPGLVKRVWSSSTTATGITALP
jgi:hypothetical protein